MGSLILTSIWTGWLVLACTGGVEVADVHYGAKGINSHYPSNVAVAHMGLLYSDLCHLKIFVILVQSITPVVLNILSTTVLDHGKFFFHRPAKLCMCTSGWSSPNCACAAQWLSHACRVLSRAKASWACAVQQQGRTCPVLSRDSDSRALAFGSELRS